MKTPLLFLLAAILSNSCYSQIAFEKGYFIDDNNQRTTCLIKNIDWKNNPTEFEYKLSETDASKKADITFIREFGVDNFSKYIRANVNIDRSKESLTELSNERDPVFEDEVLFLKVLVEGKSNLYFYREFEVKRFFYNVDHSNIEQLIFKLYIVEANQLYENNGFRRQIYNDLQCPSFNTSKIDKVTYLKKDLVRIFKEHNECHNYDYIVFGLKSQRDLLSLSIRPRLNRSSLSVQNSILFPEDQIDFEDQLEFGLGVEAEFIFPFNKNKWAFLIESTYQNFKSNGAIYNASRIFGGELNTTVAYSSIELPVGFRHYFFLDDNSKIFINASVVFDLTLQTSFESILVNGDPGFTPPEKSTSTESLAFGMGYKAVNKYSLEMRYQTGRQIIDGNKLSNWGSSYRTFSIIFGYSFYSPPQRARFSGQ